MFQVDSKESTNLSLEKDESYEEIREDTSESDAEAEITEDTKVFQKNFQNLERYTFLSFNFSHGLNSVVIVIMCL